MTIYTLTHNGTEIFKGSENGCYFELQRKQPNSASHAMKWEGWNISPKEVTEEEGKAIIEADQWSEVKATLLEALTFPKVWIKVKLEDGRTAEAHKKGIRYRNTAEGAEVYITRKVLTNVK